MQLSAVRARLASEPSAVVSGELFGQKGRTDHDDEGTKYY